MAAPPSPRHLAAALGLLVLLPGLAAQAGGSDPPSESAADPGPAIVLDGQPTRSEPVRASVTGVEQPNLLANPSFSQGLVSWRAATNEVGSGGFASLDDGKLQLRASKAARNGTLYAMQQVAKPDAGSLHFSYRAASVGPDPMRAIFLLRETGASPPVDTAFSHALTPTLDRYDWTWTPKVEGGDVQVFVRFRATRGLEQTALADDVELRPGPSVAWAVEGGRVLSSGGLVARLAFDGLGPHRVEAAAVRGGVQQWKASQVVEVPNVAPAARLAAPDPPLAEAFRLDAGLTRDADAGLRLQDPGFERLGTVWTVSAEETGGVLATQRRIDALGRAALDVQVTGATKNGTVYATQLMPVTQLQPGFLRVAHVDDGRIAGYQYILRERNATGRITDTYYAAPATKGAEGLVAVGWTPKANDTVSVQVYLRFRVLAGASARVSFLEPNVQSGLAFSYFLDGMPLGTSNVPSHAVTLNDTRLHEARVEVRDADGALANATLGLRALDAGYVWRVRGPTVLPLAPPQGLDSTGTHRSDRILNSLADPTFRGESGWRLGGETGGEAGWHAVDSDGPAARVSVDGERAGSTYLTQDLDRRCLHLACTFSFSARLVSGEARLQPILRAVVQPAGAPTRNVDLAYNLPLGPDWSFNATAWAPPAQDVVRLQVFLRILTDASTPAVVDFRDPYLGPAIAVRWLVEGPDGIDVAEGSVAEPRLEAPGVYLVELAMTPDVPGVGLAPGLHRFPVEALPVAFFRTLDGVGLRVEPARPGATVTALDADGVRLWSQPLDPGSSPAPGVPAFSDGPAWFLLADGAVASFRLDNGTARADLAVAALARQAPAPLGPVGLETEHHGWSSYAIVRVPVGDPSLRNATVTVTAGGERVRADAVLRHGQDGPDGLDGTLTARVRIPTAWANRTATVAVEATDGWGRTFQAEAAGTVDANPVLLPSVSSVAVALVLVPAGLALLVVRRRRRR